MRLRGATDVRLRLALHRCDVPGPSPDFLRTARWSARADPQHTTTKIGR